MKKPLAILTISLASLAAFAQGKISFATDSLHLVYFDYSWGPFNYSFTGQAVSSTNGLPGVTAVADLYMGTSSSTLYYYTSATFGTTPGKWNQTSVTANANPTTGAPAIPGGTTVFVVAQVRDDRSPPENVLTPGVYPGLNGAYYGASQEFTFTLGSGVTFPLMSGANGTWSAGTFILDQYGVGSRGAINIPEIPEPYTVALVGFGAAAMLILRRRQ
jgi:hypothetical protein